MCGQNDGMPRAMLSEALAARRERARASERRALCRPQTEKDHKHAAILHLANVNLYTVRNSSGNFALGCAPKSTAKALTQV